MDVVVAGTVVDVVVVGSDVVVVVATAVDVVVVVSESDVRVVVWTSSAATVGSERRKPTRPTATSTAPRAITKYAHRVEFKAAFQTRHV